MGDNLNLAGQSMLIWLQRNAAWVASSIFALGFAWSQFGALERSVGETRADLKALHDAFVEFRVDASRSLLGRGEPAYLGRAGGDGGHDALIEYLGGEVWRLREELARMRHGKAGP